MVRNLGPGDTVTGIDCYEHKFVGAIIRIELFSLVLDIDGQETRVSVTALDLHKERLKTMSRPRKPVVVDNDVAMPTAGQDGNDWSMPAAVPGMVPAEAAAMAAEWAMPNRPAELPVPVVAPAWGQSVDDGKTTAQDAAWAAANVIPSEEAKTTVDDWTEEVMSEMRRLLERYAPAPQIVERVVEREVIREVPKASDFTCADCEHAKYDFSGNFDRCGKFGALPPVHVALDVKKHCPDFVYDDIPF